MRQAVKRIASDASDRAISARLTVGGYPIDHSTVGRKLAKGDDWLFLVHVARAYGKNPIDALLEVGVLEHADLARWAARYVLADLTDLQLSEEILARVKERTITTPEVGGVTPPEVESPDRLDIAPETASGVTPVRGSGDNLRDVFSAPLSPPEDIAARYQQLMGWLDDFERRRRKSSDPDNPGKDAGGNNNHG